MYGAFCDLLAKQFQALHVLNYAQILPSPAYTKHFINVIYVLVALKKIRTCRHGRAHFKCLRISSIIYEMTQSFYIIGCSEILKGMISTESLYLDMK
jgi:hypothetical protein